MECRRCHSGFLLSKRISGKEFFVCNNRACRNKITMSAYMAFESKAPPAKGGPVKTYFVDPERLKTLDCSVEKIII